MKKKTILILLSLLHICVFCIGILIIFQHRETKHMDISLSSDATVRITDTEPETVIEVSPLAESEPEETFVEQTFVEEPLIEKPSIEESSIEESSAELSEETLSYTFQYVRGKRNLNIRNAPSMQARIIGKIPPGQGGRVLEFANDDWALIEYRGTTGYSSRHWMKLTPLETD